MRWLFWATVVWGAAIIWMAPHPPMTDLPQHAGQIALWRDLLTNRTPFGHVVQVNLATPYLIGYGLALPLSFVMPVAVAIQCVFTAAYLSWIGLCIALRRDFDSDPRLDWLFVVPMFGFAYRWGFFTFLVAAPLGLLLVLCARRHLSDPGPTKAASLLVVGLLLLLSHGLTFLYAFTIALLISAYRLTMVPSRPRDRTVTAWVAIPPILFVIAAGVLFLLGREAESKVASMMGPGFDGAWDWRRLYRVPLYAVGTGEDRHFPLVALALLASPWVMSSRPAGWADPRFWVVLATVSFVLVLPSYAASTAFLYERFGLFLLPAYAWCFKASRPKSEPSSGTMRRAGAELAVAACWAVLVTRSQEALAFGRETRAIDGAIARLQPGERLLSIALDRSSSAARSASAYLHYGSWYQAERHGFTDFNFAWFPPQVVRFRAHARPSIEVGFDWNPSRFRWNDHRADDYRYFLIRHPSTTDPSTVFVGAPCTPAVVERVDGWTIFERSACRR